MPLSNSSTAGWFFFSFLTFSGGEKTVKVACLKVMFITLLGSDDVEVLPKWMLNYFRGCCGIAPNN